MEEKEFTVIDGGVTEADIMKWKNQHGKVMLIEIEEADTVHHAYFKRPTLNTMAAVTRWVKPMRWRVPRLCSMTAGSVAAKL